MSALYRVLSAMDEAIQKTTVSKDGLKVTVNSALINWDHQRFVDDSGPYLMELFKGSKKAKVLLPDHLNEQKKVIRALTLCSKKLSAFISENVNIAEAMGLASKKKRK
jgi:hypothetical protein